MQSVTLHYTIWLAPIVALVAALGIVAGILPALQAMRLRIAVALRRGA